MRRSRIQQIKPQAAKPQPKKPYVPLASVYESIKPAVVAPVIETMDFTAQYIAMLQEMSHADVIKALKNSTLKPSEARTLFEHLLPHQRRAILEEQSLHEFSAAGGLMTGGYDAGSPAVQTQSSPSVPTCTDNIALVTMVGFPPPDGVRYLTRQSANLYVYGDETVDRPDASSPWSYKNSGSPFTTSQTVAQFPWLAQWAAPYVATKTCPESPVAPSLQNIQFGVDTISVDAYNFGTPLHPISSFEYRVDAGSWMPLAVQSSGPGYDYANLYITGLTQDVEYTVDVRGVSLLGAGPMASTVGSTGYRLPGPPIFSSLVEGDGQLDIEVHDENEDPQTPQISYEYRVDGDDWIPLAHGPGQYTGLTVSGLSNGTTYTIDIRSINPAGASVTFLTFQGTPATVPSAPIFNSLTNGPTCDTVVVDFTPQSDGGAPIQGYYLYSYRGPDGERYQDLFNGPSPATVSCPGAGGGGMSQAQIYAYNGKGDGEPSAANLNLDVNACHIRISGSTYSFLNGTFDRRNYGYEVRIEDAQPYDGFKYTGTTYAYTPSAADDSFLGANIIMGPNTTLADISENYTIYTNPNKWSYLTYSYDSDYGIWNFTEVFYNVNTGSTIPLGTWTANGGWGSNITVS